MNNTKPIFEYRKKQFDDKYSSGQYSLIFLTPIVLPFIIFRNGFLDFTYLPLLLMFYISLILISLPVPFFKIRIFQNEMIATNIFGIKKTISNNLITYNESYFVREDGTQTVELTIKYNRRNFKVYKDKIYDYETLKSFCKTNYRKFVNDSFNYYYFSIAIVVLLGVLLQFCSTLNIDHQEFDNKQSIKEKGYIKIKGTVKEYETVGKNGKQLWIELGRYPKFDFSPVDFSQNKKKYFEIIKSKESLTLYISPNQFEKKITKKKKLNFYDKYFRYNEISTYKIE